MKQEKDLRLLQQVIIRRRGDIMPHLEGELAHRELKRTVLLLIQRIGENVTVIPFMTLRTVCPVTIPEEMRVQGCHRTSGKAQAQVRVRKLKVFSVSCTKSPLFIFISCFSAGYTYLLNGLTQIWSNRMQQKLGIRMCKAVCRTVKCTVFDNLTAAHHHHTVCKI